MPTKRSAAVPTLSRRDLTFNEWFSFIGGWWRPEGHHYEDIRWSTWPEYFAAYELVRAELLAEQGPRRPPFAEHARICFNAGTDPAEASRTQKGEDR